MRALSPNNPRVIRTNSVEHLIVVGLGYCCEWMFWQLYHAKPTELIAARLGVEPCTIRRHRAWFFEGRFECECKGKCMAAKLNQENTNELQSEL